MRNVAFHALQHGKGRKGIVLILTVVVMTALLSVAGAFLYMTSVHTRGVGFNMVSAKAFWIAEAGLQQVIYQLKNDSGYRSNPTTVSANLGGGSYEVTVSKDASTSTYTLTSIGAVDVLSRKITQRVVEVPDAFNYACYISPNANLSNTTNGVINGNFMVDQNVSGEGDWTINGTLTQNGNITIPTVDFASYRTIADHVVIGNFTFQENQTYTGLYYITGVTKIESNVIINGGLVTEGTVNMRAASEARLNPISGRPAIITSGAIDMSSSVNSGVNGKGIIYAQQGLNLQQASNVAISGTIIIDQNLNVKNADKITFTYDPDILVHPPPYFTGSVITLTPQGWNEIMPDS